MKKTIIKYAHVKMAYDYDDIAHRWFEEYKLPFVNYIRANFVIDYDGAMDLYVDCWMELRKIILDNRATDTKWKSLLFLIGKRQAIKDFERRPTIETMGQHSVDEENFNRKQFEYEQGARKLDEYYTSVYENPELQAVLGAELSYIPDPCNKILKMYYFDEFSMTEIAEAMNYRSSSSAKTTKKRCMDKLKARVKNAVRRLGILDNN